MKSLIEFENLSRCFATRWAIKDASGKLCLQDKVILLGPNGAGKTTLLYLLAGVLRPDRGKIHREDITLSLLSHQPMLYRRLSAEDNLLFFLQLAGLSAATARKRAYEALEFFSLKKRRGDSPDTFSRGMLQRLMLAKIAAIRPQVVFFDEPFTGLDAQAQQLLENLILQQGIIELGWSFSTMILVDHDLDRARKLGKQVWHIEEGKLQV